MGNLAPHEIEAISVVMASPAALAVLASVVDSGLLALDWQAVGIKSGEVPDSYRRPQTRPLTLPSAIWLQVVKQLNPGVSKGELINQAWAYWLAKHEPGLTRDIAALAHAHGMTTEEMFTALFREEVQG